MNIYYSERMAREEFLKAAFAREGIVLADTVFPRTERGKPYLPHQNAPFFSLTHTGDFLAVAIGKEQVGLDAEKNIPRRTDALSRRLTESEREEDFSELWTAKEAFVKYRGETLAALLPRLEYAGNALSLDGARVSVFLRHFRVDGFVLCLCTERETEIRLISLD